MALQITSRYLTMRDGIRLAVDVYFPSGHQANQPLPVLLHQTRYWRRAQFRVPFRWFMSPFQGHEGKLVEQLVQAGYAFVNVDARGSGASFGNRAYPWTPDEIQDGYEVMDWIVEQEWSNGKIGTLGISYTGTAAEFAASTGHPALKAVMPLFSLYDVYDDIALPGGIPHDGFVKPWGIANRKLDENKFPLPLPLAKMLIQGVAPVKGEVDQLELAVEAHNDNLNVDETAGGVYFRDQAPANGSVATMDEFSPHTVTEKINATGIPVFAGSGWFDGAYQQAAIKRFLNLKTPVNKLVLGAWNHGGKYHITPGMSRKSGAELVDLPLQFFDHYLKETENDFLERPSVSYFTMVAEEWRSAPTWPPPEVVESTLFLKPDGHLTQQSLPAQRSVEFSHNPDSGTGHETRWRGVLGQVYTHRYYPHRLDQTMALLHFDTVPLSRDVEVTGNALAEIWMETEAEDAAFFVYLDDVYPDGRVEYVTEGILRASHRREHGNAVVCADCAPYRSYLQADASPLPQGEPVLLRIGLLPTSYLLRKGHCIRISIATADKDNFADVTPEGSRFNILCGGSHSSRVIFPVAPPR